MTFGSLFAGIGGMDLGLERAGMTCKWQVEIDPFCRQVLTKHWPEVPKYGDIRDVTADQLGYVDCIAGGFPCQDLSRAGKRAGMDGARSGLWKEFYRLICLLRPRVALVENVPGLLDWGLGRVLGDLAESGYDAEWSVLPAAAFGAPHVRERVFVVAYSNSQRGEVVSQANSRDGGSFSQAQGKYFRGDSRPDLAKFWRDAIKLPNGLPCKPRIAMLVNGIPLAVDRLGSPGNAVVPQVAEWIGRRIIEAEQK